MKTLNVLNRISRICLALVAMTALNANLWGDNCTYPITYNNVTDNNVTGTGKVTTICTANETAAAITAISFDIEWESVLFGKDYQYEVFSSDGGSLGTGSVGNGKKGSFSKSGLNLNAHNTFTIKYTGNKIGTSNRTLKLTNIKLTFKHAPTLSNSGNITMTTTPVGKTTTQNVTVNFQNSTNSGTLTATETADATGSFSISPASRAITDCSGSTTYTVTFEPTAAHTNATATYTISGNGASTSFTVTGTSQATVNPVFTCNLASSYMVDASSVDLSSLWTSNNKEGAITYSIVSFTPNGEQSGGQAPAIINNKTLTLGAPGTLTLKLSQAATGQIFYAGEDTKTITINRHDRMGFTWNIPDYYFYDATYDNYVVRGNTDVPLQSSSTTPNVATATASGDVLSLTTYNVAGTTTISVTQPETYYYKAKTETQTISPQKRSNHLTLDITSSNYNASGILVQAQAGSFSWSNGSIDLYTFGTWNDKYVVYTFTGIPDKLTFSYHGEWDATSVKWYANESSDGVNWTEKWSTTTNSSSFVSPGDIQLSPTTRYVRIGYSGNLHAYFKDIRITELQQFAATPDSIGFGEVLQSATQTYTKNFTFKHANAGYNVTASSNDSHFTVESTVAQGQTGGDKMGETTVTVTYHPTDIDTHAGLITLTDQLGHSIQVKVTGRTRDKLRNTIVTTMNGNTTYSYLAHYGEEISLEATSDNTDYTHYPITVSQIDGEDIATYDPDTKKIKAEAKDGTATFRLTQPTDDQSTYVEDTAYISVIVAPAQTDDCYVLYDMNSYTLYGIREETYQRTWEGTNVAGTLTMSVKRDAANVSYGLRISQYINGAWHKIEYIEGDNLTSNWTEKSYSLNPEATGILVQSYGSLNNYVRNITVTRNTYLTTPETLVCPERLEGTASTQATFTVAYSSCSDGNIHIVSNSDKFSILPTDILVADGTSGSATVTVTYHSDVVGDFNGDITINNTGFSNTLHVSGRTFSKQTPIIQKGDGGRTMLITRDTLNPAFHDISYLMREQFKTNNNEHPDTLIELVGKPEGVLATSYKYDPVTTHFYSEELGTYTFRVTHSETEHFTSISDTFCVTVQRFTPIIYWYLNEEEYIDGTYLIGDGHPAINQGDTLKVACVSNIESFEMSPAQYANIKLVEDASKRTNGIAAIISPEEEDVLVTLTARSAETKYYNAVSAEKTFIVTRKLRQTIVWDDDLSALMTDYRKQSDGSYTDELIPQEVQLTGYTINDDGTPTNLPITYTITPLDADDTTKEQPSDWSLTTDHTTGVTTFHYTTRSSGFAITATQNEQTTYAPAAPMTKQLNVYDFHDGCAKEDTILEMTIPTSINNGKSINSSDYRVYNLFLPSSVTLRLRKDKDGAWMYNELRPVIIDFYDGSVEGTDSEGRCTGNLILSKTIAPNDIPININDPQDFTLDGIPDNARSMYIHTASDHGFRLLGVSYVRQQYAHPAVDQITILAFSSQPSDPEKFSVNWMNDVVFVECTNKRCTVTPTSFGECGGQGIARMSVVFNAPALPTTETGNIIFRDMTGNVLAVVPLTAQVNYGITQRITSFNVKPSYYTVDSVELHAVSDRPEMTEFTYSVDDPEVAYIETDPQTSVSKLKFYRSGVISVTAYQAGTQDIAPATLTVENVMVEKTPLIDLVPPVAKEIDYGNPMSESTLYGGSANLPDNMHQTPCPGHYQWPNPSEIHSANYGNPQLLSLVYIPAHEEIDFISGATVYYDERYATTSAQTNVLIRRVQPELTWTDESPITIARGDERTLNVQVTVTNTNGTINLKPTMIFSGSESLARFDYIPQADGSYTTTMTALRVGTAQLTATYPASQNFHAANPITKTLTVEYSTNFAWMMSDSAKFHANTGIPFADLILAAEGTDITIEASGIKQGDTTHIEEYVVVDNESKTITFVRPTPYYLTLTAHANNYTDKMLHFAIIENEQSIVWNQDFFDNYYDGRSFYYQDTLLEAQAIDAQGNPTNQSITYKIADNTIASIQFVNSRPVLHFKKAGVTTITATASEGGDSYYTPASATTRICVYKEGFQCSEYLYEGPTSLSGTIIYSNGVTRTWDEPNVANQLSFKGALTLNSATNHWLLIYFRTVKGENGQPDVWTLTDSVDVIGSWRDFKIDVPSNATGVRFANPKGVGINRAVTGITITRHRYFYLTEDSVHVSHLGVNVPLNRSFEARYSANPLIKYGMKDGDDVVATSVHGVTITPNRMIDNDCDYSGSYVFTLTGSWDTPQQFHDTAVVYNAAGQTFYIPIYINVENGKRFIFDRTEGGVWSQSTNWALSDGVVKDYYHGLVPGAADSVEIRTLIEIAEPTDVYSIAITGSGQVHIGPQGGLSVHQGGITGATTENFIIESTLSGQGYFRMNPEAKDPTNPTQACPMPTASVQFATRGTLDSGNDRDATWQYTGVPSPQKGSVLPYSAEWYLWSEPKGWVKNSGNNDDIVPFKGYATAPYGSETFVWKGQLINTDQTIDLTYTATDEGMWGANVFANSYASPIDLKTFEKTDFVNSENMDLTFYLYNAGSWNQWQASGETTIGSISYVSGGNSTPGHYTAIPVLSAKDLDESIDITMVASLEGVYVQTSAAGCKINLNYKKHVWEAQSSFNQMNYPARAPQHDFDENFNRVRLQVNSSSSGADYIYVLERPEYTKGYDNGYDAPKALPEINQQTTVYLYTVESYGTNEISATSNADSMYIGFLSSEDQLYTITARAVKGETFYLEDTETGTYTLLTDSAQYTFAALPNTTYERRFRIVRHQAGTVTSIDELKQEMDSEEDSDGILHVYSVTGQSLTQGNSISDLQQLPTGVYLIQMKNQIVKFIKK